MNSAVLLLGVIVWLLGGYFIYSRYIEKKLVKPLDRKKTPAKIYSKSIDYKPSNKFFLFGHHFASIAGAGPIIGPILAVSYFGWLFVTLWILIGSVFIGAIHDYLSLILSVRHKGEGIAKVSQKITGKRTFYVFSALLWFALMLIITVFSVSAAQSLVEVPQLVIPFFGITFTALLLGLGVYKLKTKIFPASVIAVLLVVFFIFLGITFPLSLPFSAETAQIFWISVLFIYALIVSLIPVWIVLQPRDYISSIGLFLFLLLGLVSVFIASPVINAPAVKISSFPVWPILFITVACGAVSGFHSLVSSGTTSKQLSKEKEGRFVGVGGMLAEALVAVLVVIFISAGLKWTTPIGGDINFFQNAFSAGWIVAFSQGFANIVGQVFKFMNPKLLILIASLIVNTFILTSLDTSTRIGRMISSEALPKIKYNNKFLLTLLILIPAYLLAITNSYATLWKLFGSSNQLIAAVVLLAITAYLVELKKPRWYTLIPGIFMIITTLAALIYQTFGSTGYLANGNIPLVVISLVLVLFALIVSYEVVKKIIWTRK